MAGKGAPPLFDLIRSPDNAPPGARPPHALRESGPAASAPPPEARQTPKATPAPEPKPERKPKREPKEPKVKRKPEPRPDRKPFWARKPHRDSEPAAEPAPEPAAQQLGESENNTVFSTRPSETPESPPPAAATGPWIDFKKKFSIPISVLYIVIPLILVGTLVAYSWGFSAGGRNRDNELKPYLQPEDIVDPLLADQGDIARGGRGAAQASTPQPPAPAAAAPRGADSAPRQGAQRSAASPVTRDTRQGDHNYLLIARMDGERAIKAAMALTERGLPTIAVESGAGRSNNGWRLYSLLGIPSEKFRQEWQLRADHKARIEAACRDLGADAGGPIDASTAYWEKYAP